MDGLQVVAHAPLADRKDRFFGLVDDGVYGLFLVVSQAGQVVGGQEHAPAQGVVLDDVPVRFDIQRGRGLVDQRQQVGLPAGFGQLVLGF